MPGRSSGTVLRKQLVPSSSFGISNSSNLVQGTLPTALCMPLKNTWFWKISPILLGKKQRNWHWLDFAYPESQCSNACCMELGYHHHL